MLHKVLNVRHRRLRRMARALLRHLRTTGLDERGKELCHRFESALARFVELHRRPNLTVNEELRIYRVRLGLLAYREQIEATLQSRITEPEKGN